LRSLVCVLILTTLSLVASQNAASATTENLNDCTKVVNDPHLSSTPGKGIDAKSNMTCPYTQTSGEINPALYRCDIGYSGIPSETWIFDHCDAVAWEFFSFSPIYGGTKYFAQVPRVGGAEVHGTGYYVQDVVFVIRNNGSTWSNGIQSHVVKIND
jgi:hypothetical protein